MYPSRHLIMPCAKYLEIAAFQCSNDILTAPEQGNTRLDHAVALARHQRDATSSVRGSPSTTLQLPTPVCSPDAGRHPTGHAGVRSGDRIGCSQSASHHTEPPAIESVAVPGQEWLWRETERSPARSIPRASGEEAGRTEGREPQRESIALTDGTLRNPWSVA